MISLKATETLKPRARNTVNIDANRRIERERLTKRSILHGVCERKKRAIGLGMSF